MRRNFTRALVTRAALALQQRSAAAADDVSWGLGDDEEIIPPPKGATTPLSQAQPSPALPAGARPVAVSAARAKAPRNDDDDLDPEWQRIDAAELSSRIVLYLNTCRAPHFISEPLEKQMFTTLVARQKELHLDQLLDLVEVRWPAPTQERYFTLVSDLTRNRIVADTEAFIKEAADAAAVSFAERMESGSASPIPQTGPTALLLARCIVVMGIRGRRRRDLELFKPLGQALALRINDIRDPHTLCYVLIAFQSARIKPPSQFLGLVGRRLPVLNKKFPISPLPAYRALMFYDKSDYELMNPYRFLADRIMAHIKNELQREGAGGDFIEPRVVTPVGGPIRRAADGDDDDLDDADFALLRGLQRNETQAEPEAAPAPRMIKKKPVSPAPEATEDVPAVPDSATNTARRSDSGEASLDSAMPDYALKPDFADAEDKETKAANLLDRGPQTDPLVEISDRRRVRERFHRITQLKPPQLTRMLYVLARRFAPRQQYLRPIANDVLIPSMEHFNPPSFSRLVRSVRHFQSEELNLLEAIVDIMCKRGADAVPLGDVLELLHLFSRPNVPLAKADKFFKLCEDMFKDSSKLRPRDALSITSELLLIRKLKFEDSDSGAPPAGTSIAPLQSLLSVVDSFAFRSAAFLELGVLALPNADALLDMGNQLEKGREPSPAMSRLLSARQAAVAEGEEAYHDLLDVDVREIFFRIQVVNSHLTHRGFRPLPANVMQEFKAMLDYMRADFILEAVHVYAQAYPGALSVPVRRVLGAFIVDKLKLELDVAMGKIAPPPPPPQPEMVAVEGDIDGHRRLFKPYDVTKPKYSPMLFTPASLTKFGNIVMATPLQRVLRSEATWRYLELKARQFKNDGLREIVIERLAAQKEEEAARELREMRGEVTAEGLKDQQEAFL